MKNSVSIVIFSWHPVFNQNQAPVFADFSASNSVHLYSSLLLNHLEVLSTLDKKQNYCFCFDERDKDFLPEQLVSHGSLIFFYKENKKAELLNLLKDRFFIPNGKNLLIFGNSIGFSSKEILRIEDLLSSDENVLVIGKSDSDRMVFAGFTNFQQCLENLLTFNLNSDQFLRSMKNFNCLLHFLAGFISVNDIEDFRTLYRELSKKESLAYCSHQMHERFTHLFIEYRDLLK
ncbi:MAG: hypothetical protein HXY49_11710 [Ignavibacteriaceae bacterium]|nr:hypothetical protein [Ignavibacteriaceae bacterium]